MEIRFVIITLPPRAVQDAVEALRRPLNQAVGASAALRYPPHLTLRTGLVCPDERAAAVATSFLDHAATQRAVPVRTEGLLFAPGLVAWSLGATAGLLALHRGLLGFMDWAKGPQGAYTPHMTLAFDDLRPGAAERLQALIANRGEPVPDFAWTVDHVALYHETPAGWVEYARTDLS